MYLMYTHSTLERSGGELRLRDLFQCQSWDSNPDLRVTKAPRWLLRHAFLSCLCSTEGCLLGACCIHS